MKHHRPCPARPPAPRPRGFTLVELLTVIAIIGVLAAIIIPIASHVRGSARMSRCMSNVRQLGIAAQIYRSEHRTLPPGDYPVYTQALAPYLNPDVNKVTQQQAGTEIDECPARGVQIDGVITRSYSANPFVLRRGPDYTGSATEQLLRYEQVSRPAEVIMFAECLQRPATSASWPGSAGFRLTALLGKYSTNTSEATANNPIPSLRPNEEPATNPDFFAYRHNNKLNAVMIDGHVATFTDGTILERNVLVHY